MVANLFEVIKGWRVIFGKKGDGYSFFPCTTSSPDTMRVILHCFSHVIVYHVGYIPVKEIFRGNDIATRIAVVTWYLFLYQRHLLQLICPFHLVSSSPRNTLWDDQHTIIIMQSWDDVLPHLCSWFLPPCSTVERYCKQYNNRGTKLPYVGVHLCMVQG